MRAVGWAGESSMRIFAALVAPILIACSPAAPLRPTPKAPPGRAATASRGAISTSVFRFKDGASVACYEASVKRPKGLVFYLQGSGYDSIKSKLGQLLIFSRLGLSAAACEKRGAGSPTPEEDAWPYATLGRRVADSTAELEHFRTTVPARSPIVLFAASEGGDVAARLAANEPAVTHAILVSTGGGMSQAEEFRLFIEKRGQYLGLHSVAELDAKLAEIRASKDGNRAWAGQPMRRWKSFMFAAPLPFWKASKAALLVIQGAADSAVPVESARKLVHELEADPTRSVRYVELPDVDHDLHNVVTGRSAVLQAVTDIADWLVANGLSDATHERRLLAELAEKHGAAPASRR